MQSRSGRAIPFRNCKRRQKCWDVMVSNKWARWAKCLQMAGVTVGIGTEKGSGEKKARLAEVTRDLRRLRWRLEQVGGREQDSMAGEWDLGAD
jgi:hypothetical protein